MIRECKECRKKVDSDNDTCPFCGKRLASSIGVWIARFWERSAKNASERARSTRERRQHPDVICPHCQNKGQVVRKQTIQGINGALVKATKCKCLHCKSEWSYF